MTWKAGVDVLCFGGTKNGLLGRRGGDPLRSGQARLGVRAAPQARRAPVLQAPLPLGPDGGLSRGRPLARVWPRRANAGARELARGLAALPGARLAPPGRGQRGLRRAAPAPRTARAQAAGARYYLWPGGQSLDGPDAEPLGARFVCSWSTTAEEIADLVGALAGAGVGAGVGAEG